MGAVVDHCAVDELKNMETNSLWVGGRSIFSKSYYSTSYSGAKKNR